MAGGVEQRAVVVVSGAPATGKSTVASVLAARLGLQALSLDPIKEALADVLGLGGEAWSDALGDAAAEIVFRLARSAPGAVAEGWWRRDRRTRALTELAGCPEVFCRCSPALAVARARSRLAADRHPIHRDVINPALLDDLERTAAEVEPLGLGGGLVVVDTTEAYDEDGVVSAVATLLGGRWAEGIASR